jgi:hypothetical protein
MDQSFRPWFRRATVALWLAGLLVVLALNRWKFEIVERPALMALAVLMGTGALVVAVLLRSARARHAALADPTRFLANTTILGWVVVMEVVIMGACIFKLSKP